jgi:hypothetical protein
MERRTSGRRPCRTSVRVHLEPGTPDDSFYLDSTDLSSKGVFLHTDLLFPVGERLALEFIVPGRAAPVRGRGRVVRVLRSHEPPGPGLGIEIRGVSTEERNALGRMSCVALRPARDPR